MIAADIGTIAIVNAIAARLARGEPVTQDLIDQLPSGVAVDLDATVTQKDGRVVVGMIRIQDGGVTFHTLHDPLDTDHGGPQ